MPATIYFWNSKVGIPHPTSGLTGGLRENKEDVDFPLNPGWAFKKKFLDTLVSEDKKEKRKVRPESAAFGQSDLFWPRL